MRSPSARSAVGSSEPGDGAAALGRSFGGAGVERASGYHASSGWRGESTGWLAQACPALGYLQLKHLSRQMDLVLAQNALQTAIRNTTATITVTLGSNWTRGVIETRLQILEEYWHNFKGNHGRLLLSTEEHALAYLANDRVEELYIEGRGTLLDRRARCLATEDSVATTSDASDSGRDADGLLDVPLSKLPRLTLPKYSGRPEEWESFRDLFIDLVHNNASLGDATKAMFYKTSVDGSAAEILRRFCTVADDYASAWAALCLRFDQPKLQVRDHFATLIELTPREEGSPEGLNELNKRRTQLERLNRPVQRWDDWFVFLGCRALDALTRRAWEEELEQEVTLDQFADFLQRRYRTLRSLATATSNSATSSSIAKRKLAQPSTARPIRTLATGVNPGRGGCPACKEAHYIGHCLTFRELDPEERRRLVSARVLCYNCLGSNHTARNCPSSGTCRSCAGAHHTLIHEDAGRNARQDSGESSPADQRGPKAPRMTIAATQSVQGKDPSSA